MIETKAFATFDLCSVPCEPVTPTILSVLAKKINEHSEGALQLSKVGLDASRHVRVPFDAGVSVWKPSA